MNKIKHPKPHLIKYEFKPKYTQENIDLIKKMKLGGQDKGDIFYVLRQKRPDVSVVTIERWIDSVKV